MNPFTLWINPPYQVITEDFLNWYGLCGFKVYWRQPKYLNVIRLNLPGIPAGTFTIGIMERRDS